MPVAYTCLIAATAFVLGYLAGRLDTLVVRLGARSDIGPAGAQLAPANTLRAAMREQPSAGKIEIDAGKYVGQISTDTLQKTQQLELGKTTHAQDDINSSVNKLAQLKGK